MSVCENLDNIEVSKLKRYIKNLKNEKVVYTKELYNEFSKVLALAQLHHPKFQKAIF